MVPLWERMLKLWKISAMDIVKNAMVVPAGLFAIAQVLVSMKFPTKKERRTV